MADWTQGLTALPGKGAAWQPSAQPAQAAPESYQAPEYDTAERTASAATGVPADLIQRVRTRGERSNASQVSPAGARTVYQIIQPTRDAILKKYGVDAYSSDPAEQAHAAALVLKESLDKHNGNHTLALEEYHGGPDQSKWGPKTRNYAGLHEGKDTAPGGGWTEGLTPYKEPKASEQPASILPTKTRIPAQVQAPASSWLPSIVNASKLGLASAVDTMSMRELKEPANIAKVLGPQNKVPADYFARKIADPDMPDASKSVVYQIMKGAAYNIGAAAPMLPVALEDSLASLAKGAVKPFAKAIANEVILNTMSAAGSLELGKAGSLIGQRTVGEVLGGLVGPGGAMMAVKGLGKITGPAMRILSMNMRNFSEQFLGAEHKLTKMLAPKATDVQHAAGVDVGKVLASHPGTPEAPGSVSNAQRQLELQKKYPGYQPKLPEATANPAMLALKRQKTLASADLLAKAAENKAQLQHAAGRAHAAAFPTSEDEYVKLAGQSVADKQASLDDQVKSINNQLRVEGAKVKTTGMAEVGDKIRALFKKKSDAMHGIEASKYDAAARAFDKLGFRQDVTPIVSKLKELLGADENKWAALPPEFQQIARAYGPKTVAKEEPLVAGKFRVAKKTPEPDLKDISYKELRSLSQAVNKEFYATARSENRAMHHYYGELRDTLDGTMKALENTQFGPAAKLAGDANRYHATEIRPKLYEGVGGAINAIGKRGKLIKPEAIVQRLMSSPTGIAQARALFKDDKEFVKQVRKGVMDRLAKTATKDGIVNPAKLRAFLTSNAEWVDRVPGLRRRIEAPAEASQKLLEHQVAINKSQAALDKSDLVSITKSKDPAADIATRMRTPKGLDSLVETAEHNPEQAHALSGAIAKQVGKLPDPAQFLRENGAHLKPLLDRLGPNHYQNLLDISDMRSTAARVHVPGAITPEPYVSTTEAMTGSSPSQIFNRMTSPVSQKGWKQVVKLAFNFSKMIQARDMEKAQDAIFYDHELSQTLGDIARAGGKATPEQRKALSRQLLVHEISIVPIGVVRAYNAPKTDEDSEQ
jgi:hypothetical protein